MASRLFVLRGACTPAPNCPQLHLDLPSHARWHQAPTWSVAIVPGLSLNFAPISERAPGVGKGQAAGAGTSEPAGAWRAFPDNQEYRDYRVHSHGWAATAAPGRMGLLSASGPKEHREAWVCSHNLGSCSCTQEGRAPVCSQPPRAKKGQGPQP